MHDFLLRIRRRMMPSVRGLAFCGAAMVLMLGTSPALKAAPVILRFEATITEIVGSLDSSPLAIETDDKITGLYVFQGADFVDGQTDALGSNAFDFNGFVLQSNNAGLVLNPGLLLPTINPPSTLQIRCNSPTDVFPGCNSNRFPGDENFIWEPTFTLYAAPDALETLADVRSLSSLADAQAFGTFRMVISELDPMQASLQQVLTLSAEVTSLTVVPEPASLFLCVFALVLAAARLRFPI